MRPTRISALVDTAYIWAARSTCSRLSVGAVVHREGRILTQGYNGAPAGMPHCNHECTCTGKYPYTNEHQEVVHQFECPAPMPCYISVHAEANAVAFAARWGVGLEGAELVVTNQPCLNCAMLIINSGLKSVTYVQPYRLPDGIQLLESAGIEVLKHIDPELPE